MHIIHTIFHMLKHSTNKLLNITLGEGKGVSINKSKVCVDTYLPTATPKINDSKMVAPFFVNMTFFCNKLNQKFHPRLLYIPNFVGLGLLEVG